MRILFISAFYPPHIVGGWEQLVEDIDRRLQSRGHTTHVLTSTDPSGAVSTRDPHISRALSLESNLIRYQPLLFFRGRTRRHAQNLETVEKAIARFQPDLIFVHVMWNLWRGVPWVAEQRMPGRVIYYVADDWPIAASIHHNYWQQDANHPWLRLPKRVIGRLALKQLAQEEQQYRLGFENVICVSDHVRQNLIDHLGLRPDQVCVINNGVEIDRFFPAEGAIPPKRKTGSLSLLYAGGLVAPKGVHTAIEAMAILARQGRLRETHLTLVGSGHPDYEASLKQTVAQARLGSRVDFWGRIPREEMPALMRRFDALVFPSTGEALPRIVQEAMACGLPVIGTTAGGTKEILFEGKTGLTFEPGDADRLAEQIFRLMNDAELYSRLAESGRALVVQNFDIEKTIDHIEAYLEGKMPAWPSKTSVSVR